MKLCFVVCILVLTCPELYARRGTRDLSERSRRGWNVCTNGMVLPFTCHHNQSYYGYNPWSRKCEKYKNCTEIYGAIFSKREDCYENCLPNSTCLDIESANYYDDNGKEIYYYYSAQEDTCVEMDVIGVLDDADLWPEQNLFRYEDECLEQCAPEYS
ncbi:hypothetical protein MTO96_034441 [Rhipicephalus appendiculatus]